MLHLSINELSTFTLIEDMWETMYASNGVGLAAPQIGLSVRLFVIDAAPFAADEELDAEEVKTLESFKKVFINPKIITEEGDRWAFNEGCLSIPEVREDPVDKMVLRLDRSCDSRGSIPAFSIPEMNFALVPNTVMPS